MPFHFSAMLPLTSTCRTTTPFLAALGCALLLGFSGCAMVSDKIGGWLSSNSEALAVVDGRVLRGQANFAREREATFQLQTQDQPALSCFGTLRFTATASGVIDMSCNDGRALALAFQSLGPLSGIGRGLLGNVEFGLTFGLSPERAAAYLAVPADRLMPPKPKDAAPAPSATGANPV
jgi:hypothetical protein